MQTKIVVIEDLFEIQHIVQRVLERAGFQVFCAHDGREGIELAQRERPDLLLIDLTLPTLNGQLVAQQLRSLPEFRNVPILAMSGKIKEDMDPLIFNGYIAKPFDLSELVDTVRSYMSQSGKERQV